VSKPQQGPTRTLKTMMTYCPPVTILGTGRNGSTYISKVLRHAGIDCGHEEWWTPYIKREKFQLDADSSVFGYPFVSNLFQSDFQYKGTVLTQVRDPLKTIASLAAVGDGHFMAGNHPDDLIWQHHVVREPRLAFIQDPIYNSAYWWLHTTRKCLDVSSEWWRVEDIDGHLLQQICKWARWTVDLERCEAAVSEVATDTHQHSSTITPLTWEDIPDTLRQECQALATELGY